MIIYVTLCPQLLEYSMMCTIHNSAKMTLLEEVISVIEKGELEGKMIVLAPTPAIQGSMVRSCEQMDDISG